MRRYTLYSATPIGANDTFKQIEKRWKTFAALY
jgi:hypothetical protein